VLAQQGDDLLQRVAILAGDAHDVGVDAGLHLELGILNELDDFFRLLNGDALLHFDLLADGAAGGRLDFAVLEGLERDVALGQLALKNVGDGLELVVVGAGESELGFAVELDVGVRPLEVVALGDLLERLLNGVLNLGDLDVADDIERIFCGHWFLVYDKAGNIALGGWGRECSNKNRVNYPTLRQRKAEG